MDKEKRKAIEEAGFRVTTVKEFLGLTEEENQLIELKVTLARRIRELRAKANLTQQQLASRLNSSQSRVAKIESADPSVSLELMARAFFLLGGKLTNLAKGPARTKIPAPRPASPKGSKSISPHPLSPRPVKVAAPVHASSAVAKPKGSKARGGLVGSGSR